MTHNRADGFLEGIILVLLYKYYILLIANILYGIY